MYSCRCQNKNRTRVNIFHFLWKMEITMLPMEILNLFIFQVAKTGDPKSYLATLLSCKTFYAAISQSEKEKIINSFLIHIVTNKEKYSKFPNGMKHGFYQSWWANGKPDAEGYYSFGLKIGRWAKFFEHGFLRTDGNYSIFEIGKQRESLKEGLWVENWQAKPRIGSYWGALWKKGKRQTSWENVSGIAIWDDREKKLDEEELKEIEKIIRETRKQR